jgi:hypothetical protein
MLARNRRVSVGPAHARRVSVGAGARIERRIAKTITAASRRRSLALRQGVKAAAQSAVIHDVTAAILVWARRGRCCTPKKCCAGDRRGARSQKLFHGLSPGFVRGLEGRVKLGHSVPLSRSQIGTGWSTVQSPPVIETMPCGSTASTPEVVAAAVLTRVMMPARNRRDYDDIPAGARKKLEFVWLERVDDASAAALEVGVAPLARRVGVATQTVQSAVAARYARCPNPCVVIGPSRNPALRSRLGPSVDARRHAFARIYRVSGVSEPLSRIIHVAAEFI